MKWIRRNWKAIAVVVVAPVAAYFAWPYVRGFIEQKRVDAALFSARKSGPIDFAAVAQGFPRWTAAQLSARWDIISAAA